MARDPFGGRADAVRLQVKLMSPTRDLPCDESGALEYRQVLGDLRGRFRERSREISHSLVTQLTKPGEQAPACRVTQREEHLVELCLAKS